MAQRILAIGDIHGSVSRLRELLAALELTPDDTLIFSGDYTDRGEDSKATLDFLMDIEKRQDCIFLLGNHDQMLLDTYAGNQEARNLWLYNGGAKTQADFGNQPIPKPYLDFLARTKLWAQTDDYIFVHAGIGAGKTLETSTREELLWQRDPFLSSNESWGKTVIYGHTINLSGPRIGKNKIGIDTGAFVPEGALTCLILPEMTFARCGTAL